MSLLPGFEELRRLMVMVVRRRPGCCCAATFGHVRGGAGVCQSLGLYQQHKLGEEVHAVSHPRAAETVRSTFLAHISHT